MHSTFEKLSDCPKNFKKRKSFQFNLKNARKIFFAATIFISTSFCAYHSFLTIRRFLEFEVQLTISVTKNQSLQTPMVTLILESRRNFGKNETAKTGPEMKFQSSLNGQDLPKWAHVDRHQARRHSIAVNQINTAYCRNSNIRMYHVTKTVLKILKVLVKILNMGVK